MLHEIEKQALKADVKIKCLLQLHIADEETKFGFSEAELSEAMQQTFANIELRGLMGMASFTSDEDKIKKEFGLLVQQYKKWQSLTDGFETLSMGMSGDYKIAVASGSNMVRIGSLLFGSR